MSEKNKDLNLKEKLKQALSSTIRVISDEAIIKNKREKKRDFKKSDHFDLENLNTKNDFIKARAEFDSQALKKKFKRKLYSIN